MTEINSKGLFEIKCRGKDIILTYVTKEAAWTAYMKEWDKVQKIIDELGIHF